MFKKIGSLCIATVIGSLVLPYSASLPIGVFHGEVQSKGHNDGCRVPAGQLALVAPAGALLEEPEDEVVPELEDEVPEPDELPELAVTVPLLEPEELPDDEVVPELEDDVLEPEELPEPEDEVLPELELEELLEPATVVVAQLPVEVSVALPVLVTLASPLSQA